MTSQIPVAVRTLAPDARAELFDHLAALSGDDRRLRFGASVSTDAILGYVERVDFSRDVVFGVYDERLELAGAVHVAIAPEGAELGVSVLPAHRRRGIGSALFARGAQYARNRRMPRLFMHCLAENDAMMSIARRAGMHVSIGDGDADARIELPPASLASLVSEFAMEQFARYDYTVKAQIAAVSCISQALRVPVEAGDQGPVGPTNRVSVDTEVRIADVYAAAASSEAT